MSSPHRSLHATILHFSLQGLNRRQLYSYTSLLPEYTSNIPAPVVLPSGLVPDAGAVPPVEAIAPAPLIAPAPVILSSNAMKEKQKEYEEGCCLSTHFLLNF